MGKAIKLYNKQTGESLYPITASDLVLDPVTKTSVKADLANKQPTISDLDTIRANAAMGATALQSVPSEYVTESELEGKGYATESSVNSALGDKQDKTLKFENVSASTWVEDTTYADYPYRCDLACSGVLSTDYAEVIFGIAEATGGTLAPICETKADIVSIWSSSDAAITVPTIIITK